MQPIERMGSYAQIMRYTLSRYSRLMLSGGYRHVRVMPPLQEQTMLPVPSVKTSYSSSVVTTRPTLGLTTSTSLSSQNTSGRNPPTRNQGPSLRTPKARSVPLSQGPTIPARIIKGRCTSLVGMVDVDTSAPPSMISMSSTVTHLSGQSSWRSRAVPPSLEEVTRLLFSLKRTNS